MNINNSPGHAYAALETAVRDLPPEVIQHALNRSQAGSPTQSVATSHYASRATRGDQLYVNSFRSSSSISSTSTITDAKGPVKDASETTTWPSYATQISLGSSSFSSSSSTHSVCSGEQSSPPNFNSNSSTSTVSYPGNYSSSPSSFQPRMQPIGRHAVPIIPPPPSQQQQQLRRQQNLQPQYQHQPQYPYQLQQQQQQQPVPHQRNGVVMQPDVGRSSTYGMSYGSGQPFTFN